MNMEKNTFKIEIKDECILCFGTIDDKACLELDKCVELKKDDKFIIDFSKVMMITSNLVDCLNRYLDKQYKFELKGINKEIYTIFKYVGLDKRLGLAQQSASVNVEGCKLLGKGFHSAVYQIDEDKIAKIYYDLPNIDMLINERIVARQAFVKGVPTEISFGICESEGKIGLMYELVNAKTLLSLFVQDENNIEKYVKDYVSILKKINTFDSNGIVSIPHVNDILNDDINDIEKHLGKDGADKLRNVLNSMGDSYNLLHGDAHPANVMLTDRGMVFIDLSDMRTGSGIFDLVYLHRTFIQFNKLPSNTYELKSNQTKKLWKLFFNEYYSDKTEDEKKILEDKISLMSLVSITARFLRKDVNAPNTIMMYDELKSRVAEL